MTTLFDWGNIYFIILGFLQQEAITILLSAFIIIAVGRAVVVLSEKYVKDDQRKFAIRKSTHYATYTFLVIWLLLLFNSHVQENMPFVLFLIGLFFTGVAISMRDVFSNFVGWFIIISGKGFRSGDRITVDGVVGDVIDIGVLRTIVAEIGNWVDADQSTGRLVSIPNSFILSNAVYNYTEGFNLIWNENKFLITFESDWEKAEKILHEIAVSDFMPDKKYVTNALKKVKKNYMLSYNYITPKVYVKVMDSGVELSLRYMVTVRRRRTLEDLIAREVLIRFNKESDINFAYPTIRYYSQEN